MNNNLNFNPNNFPIISLFDQNSNIFLNRSSITLSAFLDNNSNLKQYFVASGSYDDDDDGDRYEGTYWGNR